MKNNQHIVIVGGGSAGWMAAAALSNAFGASKKITLIESDAIGTVGVGEATIPAVKSFNKLLGIDEAEFLRATQGTFKLGIQFENWGEQGETYMHPFGLVGKDSWMANFQHFWLKARRMGIAGDYFDYSLNIRAAKSNKFFIDPQSGLDYAYHFDAGLYAALLRQYSEARGVVRREGLIDSVHTNDMGFIASLRLASGEMISGDLFIDCSGFRALLIEQTLHTGFEDWSHWLPCDRAVAVQTESVGEPIPYTRSIAHSVGWQWRIPLQHRVGNGLVYCSRYISDEAAKALLLENLAGDVRTEPRLIKFRTGRAIQQWHKNCVAIGLSSGFLEPLESTSLHLIQTGIVRLIRLFPGDDGINQAQIDEYNCQSRYEYERIRDFIILHYHVTRRSDSDFWNYCRTMSIPDTLAHKIHLYKNTTSVFREQDELFLEGSWQQVMLGQGLTPGNYHPVVDKMSDDELTRLMTSIEREHNQRLAQFPGHQQFIDHYCKAM